MLATNARKTLAKVAAIRESGRFITGQVGEFVISCSINGPHDANDPAAEIATVNVRRISDRDDYQTDYFAGSYFDSLAAAIKWASRNASEEAEALSRHGSAHALAPSQGCMFCIRASQGRTLSLVAV